VECGLGREGGREVSFYGGAEGCMNTQQHKKETKSCISYKGKADAQLPLKEAEQE